MTLFTPLTDAHLDLLTSSGISAEFAIAKGVRSATTAADLPEGAPRWWDGALPGLLFPWTGRDGHIEWQLRPDVPRALAPDEKPPKYLSRSTEDGYVSTPWNLLPGTPEGPVLIVEGTKQALAAAEYAPDGWGVLGILGCWGGSSRGLPSSALAWLQGRDVVVCMDADYASNAHVWDAAERLTRALESEAASSVRFIKLPASGTTGLDDILGVREADNRSAYLARLIELAKPETFAARRRPKDKVDPGALFDPEFGLRTEFVARALLERAPMAITAEGRFAVYRAGVYATDGGHALSAELAELTGDRYRAGHDASVAGSLSYLLRGREIPDRVHVPLLNLANGLLDVTTGLLYVHDPQHLTTVQLPVMWDEHALCPAYENWLAEAVGEEQVAALEESVAAMLDPRRTPARAVMLFGPSRSGKSTFLRILQAIAGPRNTSSATLHQLSDDPFAAAQVYGKILNVAADLSSSEVRDISLFKRLTGDDLVLGNRKFGQQFEFRNKALFAFSANTLPTVSESSRAYQERIRPFEFPTTFAGREDPSIEESIMAELPGILRRWVAALARRGTRGRDLPVAESTRRRFEEASNSATSFVRECTLFTGVPSERTTTTDLYFAYGQWSSESGRKPLGRTKFAESLRSMAPEVQELRDASKIRAWNLRLIPHSEWSNGVNDHGDAGVGQDHPAGGRVAESALITPTSRKHTFIDSEMCADPQMSGNRADSATLPPASSAPESPREAPLGYPVAQLQDDLTPVTLAGPVALDTEGCDIKEQWDRAPGDYLRLIGVESEAGYAVTTDQTSAAVALAQAPMIIGHNLLSFDGPHIERAAMAAGVKGPDLIAMARQGRLFDTLVADTLLNPPPAHMKPERALPLFSLAESAARWSVAGKTDNLKELAEKHGGFDKIPLDDAEYHAYLRGDVTAHGALARAMAPSITPYHMREMRVAAIAGAMTSAGVLVDKPLLAERTARVKADKAAMIEVLRTEFGVTATTKAGKPSTSPQSTDEGKLAIVDAFHRLNVDPRHIPKTGEGAPSMGKDAMGVLAKMYAFNRDVVRLCAVVTNLSGARTVYQTASTYLAADGRVHPSITMLQASGRWSVTKPGMTVFGKRGGRVVEREIFVAAEGHSLIAADLSQIDMRAIAGHSQDWAFIQNFMPDPMTGKPRDAHAETALAVFGDASRRDDAKPCNHGWQYGLGVDGAVKQGIDRSLFEQFDRGMQRAYVGLCAYREGLRDHAGAGGYLDNGFGRIMRPDRNRAYTQGPALMGQGTARDLMMKVILDLPDDIARMLRIQVHDEIVLEVKDSDVPEITDILNKTMTFEWCPPHGTIPIPIIGEVSKPGKNWAACYAK